MPETGTHEDGVSRTLHVVQGVGVSPGFAIGPAYVYRRDGVQVEERRIEASAAEGEVKRFEQAVRRSERDLQKIASVAREKLGGESAGIFEAQALMLRDAALYEAVLDRIQRNLCNADYAVQVVMEKHRRLMRSSDSEYLRERANDLLDLQERIIRHLRRGKMISAVDQGSIIIAANLTAADIVLFSRRHILGCALDYGGATSHVSIMARALGVPAVVSMHSVTKDVEHGQTVILDGLQGRVLVDPGEDVVEEYRLRQERYERFLEQQKSLVPLPAETLDGRRVTLRANLEFQQELPLLDEYGAEGIGLFRTEALLLMQRRLDIGEEEQLQIYRQVAEAAGAGGTTFRVLDLGGDKMLPMAHREHNPFLGWRGIRVLLDKPELLVPQLRAILRASAHAPIRLLVPMITHVDEIRRFRAILGDVQEALRQEGLAFDADVPVGIMVEVPAVALMASHFAEDVDFFSIGSNDLTQYTLAVDRGNDLVAELYQDLHPSVLALIQRSVEAAHAQGIPVGLCGELAANPYAAPILVGLGLDEISASPSALLQVKRVIRALTWERAQALAGEALEAPDAETVVHLMHTWMQKHACDLLHFLNTPLTEALHTPSVPPEC